MKRHTSGLAALLFVLVSSVVGPVRAAQEEPAPPPLAPPSGDPNEPVLQPPAPSPPPFEAEVTRLDPVPIEPAPEAMSEGRAIVVAYNTGFQWGLSPGVVFAGGQTAFFLGLRLGYGVDTGSAILVPGVRLSGIFTDPNIYVGMPVMKLVYPIDRFAPFVEAGAGVGHIASYRGSATETGLAVLVGGWFVVHFTARFGLGVEANYQLITGTGFDGFGVGPILALGF